jgi:GTP-binding protein
MQDENLYIELEKMAKEKGLEIYKISAVTGEGISHLLNRVVEVLKTLPKEEVVTVDEKKLYTLEEQESFTITRKDGMFIVDGPAVQNIMRRVNLEDNESMYYFQKCLDEIGVNQKLKEAGVQEGDTVKVVDWELEWYD